MTTEMAGKQLNSIYDKIDGSNPRMPNFLFYFSIAVVWGFFPLWTLLWQVHCSCLLQGWNLLPFRFAFLCSFPSHLSHPFYFSSLTIPVPLPTSCMYTHTHTHDQILRVLLIFPFLPSHPLFFLWDSQAKNATRTACAHDMLILQKQSQSLYFHQDRQKMSLFPLTTEVSAS